MKTIRNISLIFISLLYFSCASTGQIDLNKTLDNVQKEIEQYSKNPKPLTNDEVICGLREALNVGTNNSTTSASQTDGFYKNPLIFIPFPPEAIKIKNTVEKIGMKKQVGDFEMSMNRAAEEASKTAAPVFLDAIKAMSISDGFSILNGNDNAATQYLKDKTSADLTTKFTPIIKKAIQKVEVTKYWNPIITTYNKIPGVEKQNPNLEQYITLRTLDGLFKLIAGEEYKIRKDPIARITDILKKVFGSK
ncbi:MAG: DUF4197 domain-containing protein [Bacteroidota bacterium]